MLKYTLDGVEGQDFDFFKKSIREYLSPALGDEIMTLAQELQQKGEATVITRLLKHRFHDVPESYLTRIKQADEQTLLSWSDKILDAQSLEEIFE